MADFTHSVLRQRVPMQVYTRTVAYITEVYTPGAICLPLTVWSIFVQFYTAIKLWEEVIFGKLVHYSHSRSFKVIKTETYRTRSPAGAGIANRPLVFLGFFLIFGSNTPTWSVENKLNLWATNCVVNQTGYFGPSTIVRFQTSNVAMATPTHLFCSTSADGVA